MARILVLVIVAALAATPAVAVAASAAADQTLLQDTPTTQQPAPVQQTPTTVDDGSIGGGELALIGLGIVALIGGIWFVISRDARRATAGRVRTSESGLGGGSGGSATRSARRSRRLSAAEKQRRKRGRAR